jgi:hypothetical protein
VETAETGEGPFDIEYSNAAPPAPAPLATARLVVVKGKANATEYLLDKARMNLGRLAEITDADHRVTRRNDVVFEEGADEANGTVSRRHAHIRLEDGEYRLCDDGSEFGTRVFRDGRSIEADAPVALFTTRIGGAIQGTYLQEYAVSPKGDRFLMNTVTNEASVAPLTVILNWQPPSAP